VYEGISKSFRTDSITKYTLTTMNTSSEATQKLMAAKLTRLTHKMIELHLVAESCTIWSSHSRHPIRKFLDTPSYVLISSSDVHLSLPSGLFPSSFPAKILQAFLISPIYSTSTAHFTLFDLITQIIFGETYTLWSSSLCSFLHLSMPSTLIAPNIPLRHP